MQQERSDTREAGSGTHPLQDRAADSLAAAVRRRRHALALRQDELADLAGVSERFVHTVEAGKATVRLDKLLALLRALGLHLELARGAADGIRTSAALTGPHE